MNFDTNLDRVSSILSAYTKDQIEASIKAHLMHHAEQVVTAAAKELALSIHSRVQLFQEHANGETKLIINFDAREVSETVENIQRVVQRPDGFCTVETTPTFK